MPGKNPEWRVGAGSGRTYRGRPTTYSLIIEYLRENSPASPDQIGRNVGMRPEIVSNRLNELRREGTVYRVGHGRWVLFVIWAGRIV